MLGHPWFCAHPQIKHLGAHAEGWGDSHDHSAHWDPQGQRPGGRGQGQCSGPLGPLTGQTGSLCGHRKSFRDPLCVFGHQISNHLQGLLIINSSQGETALPFWSEF